MLAWDVPAEQEEPWRRFLQELSGSRYEEYAESRRRLGISAEPVWLAPRCPPEEGWRSSSWKPKTPSGRCATWR